MSLHHNIRVRVDGGDPITLAQFYRDNSDMPRADRADFERDLGKRGRYVFGGGAAALIVVELASAPPSEAARSTQDGRIWPQSRPAMSDADCIVRRMAQDFALLHSERGEDAQIMRIDLRKLGWTDAQIDRHHADACGLFRARREQKRAA